MRSTLDCVVGLLLFSLVCSSFSFFLSLFISFYFIDNTPSLAIFRNVGGSDVSRGRLQLSSFDPNGPLWRRFDYFQELLQAQHVHGDAAVHGTVTTLGVSKVWLQHGHIGNIICTRRGETDKATGGVDKKEACTSGWSKITQYLNFNQFVSGCGKTAIDGGSALKAMLLPHKRLLPNKQVMLIMLGANSVT